MKQSYFPRYEKPKRIQVIESGGIKSVIHLLQQIADLDVGVTVLDVAHLAPLAKERVCLVKEEDSIAGLGLSKDAGQILLRLAYVLADHRGKVNLVKIQPQLTGHDLSSHGLSRA